MERPTVFLTGATGFVGRRLLAALEERGYDVRALVRDPESKPVRESAARTRWIAGSLEDSGPWADELSGCDVVLHLAARTGNASAEEHLRTNCEGTGKLLEAAAAQGVSRFLFMSTIAARYPETRAYPYASSKKAAEDLVRASELPWAIVRPTIVTGPDAPGWKALIGLASLPLVPLFGGGGVRVQPVDREDLVELVLGWLEKRDATGRVLEVGGPRVSSMRELLAGLRFAAKGKRSGFLPIPVRPLIAMLAACERVGLRLPASAGQFYVFRYDSDAVPSDLVSKLLPAPREVVPSEEEEGDLQAEARTLALYLGVDSVSDYVLDRYAGLASSPAYQRPNSAFDRFLLGVAGRGALAARAADVHARFFRPNALLRRRLILMLAILESTPATEEGLDRIRATSPIGFAAGLLPRALWSGVLLVAGLFVFLPARLVRSTGEVT